MSKGFRHFLHSERQIRLTFGYVALVMVPALLLIVVLSTKFTGLSPDALDHAQLARNLATGHGFATSVVRPIAVRFTAPTGDAPDLCNAPLHPLVLALGDRLTSASEKTAAGLGLGLWVLTVWLTFFVANRLWGVRAAAITVALYGVNLAALNAALSGGAQPLATLLMLLGIWLAFPRPADKEDTAHDLAAWRLVLAGMVGALVRLTDYSLIVFVLVLGLCLVVTSPRRWRALGLFLAGYVVVNIPWWWRNADATGSPFLTLYWYNLFTNTGRHPGDSIWRTVATPGITRLLIESPLVDLSAQAGC